jgi:hypothetical protein
MKIPFEKKIKPTLETIKQHQHFCFMFIKKLIYNYNAKEVIVSCIKISFPQAKRFFPIVQESRVEVQEIKTLD